MNRATPPPVYRLLRLLSLRLDLLPFARAELFGHSLRSGQYAGILRHRLADNILGGALALLQIPQVSACSAGLMLLVTVALCTPICDDMGWIVRVAI